MNAQDASRIVGIFDGVPQAEKAVTALVAAGIPTERILIRARQWTGARTLGPRVELQEAASSGAIRSAIIGAILGAVAGFAVSQIPDLDVGAVWLVALGAALGGAIGCYVGPFIGLKTSDQMLDEEARQVHQGRIVVVVDTPEDPERVRALLVEHGAYDFSMANP